MKNLSTNKSCKQNKENKPVQTMKLDQLFELLRPSNIFTKKPTQPDNLSSIQSTQSIHHQSTETSACDIEPENE